MTHLLILFSGGGGLRPKWKLTTEWLPTTSELGESSTRGGGGAARSSSAPPELTGVNEPTMSSLECVLVVMFFFFPISFGSVHVSLGACQQDSEYFLAMTRTDCPLHCFAVHGLAPQHVRVFLLPGQGVGKWRAVSRVLGLVSNFFHLKQVLHFMAPLVVFLAPLAYFDG